MFTGIINEVGTLQGIRKGANSAVLTIGANTVLEDVHLGDSIAVNGVCLTVTSFTAIDMDGDFVPDEGEAISDGVFHESQYPGLMSAPYFNIAIDGIERLNEAY